MIYYTIMTGMSGCPPSIHFLSSSCPDYPHPESLGPENQPHVVRRWSPIQVLSPLAARRCSDRTETNAVFKARERLENEIF